MSNVDKRVSAEDRIKRSRQRKHLLTISFLPTCENGKGMCWKGQGFAVSGTLTLPKKNSMWGQGLKVGGKRQEMAGFCFRNVKPGLRTPVNTDLYFLTSFGPISEAKALHLLYSCLSLSTRAFHICTHSCCSVKTWVGLKWSKWGSEKGTTTMNNTYPTLHFLKKYRSCCVGSGWPGLGFIVNTQPQPPTGWDYRHVPSAQLSLEQLLPRNIKWVTKVSLDWLVQYTALIVEQTGAKAEHSTKAQPSTRTLHFPQPTSARCLFRSHTEWRFHWDTPDCN